MECPRAVIFDLDDTLAESFKRPSDEMLAKVGRLFARIPVAIMTGAGFPRMNDQFLSVLAASPGIERFYLFPTSSAECYVYRNGAWERLYSIALGEENSARIKTILAGLVERSPSLQNIPSYGKQLFDRETQIAFTLVGVDAPKEVKDTWDADGSKRRFLKEEIERMAPEFEVLLGGRTTIDITKKGINKSYGVEWFSRELNIPPQEMLYVGDAFFEGGNDRIVIPTGIRTRTTTGPQETSQIIDELISSL